LPVDSLPANHPKVCGSILLHPGEGIGESVSPPYKINYSTLMKASIRVKEDDRIHPRHGVCEDVGHCIFMAKTYNEEANDIVKMCDSSPVKLLRATVYEIRDCC
jgi:hypothetical protein